MKTYVAKRDFFFGGKKFLRGQSYELSTETAKALGKRSMMPEDEARRPVESERKKTVRKPGQVVRPNGQTEPVANKATPKSAPKATPVVPVEPVDEGEGDKGQMTDEEFEAQKEAELKKAEAAKGLAGAPNKMVDGTTKGATRK